MGVVILFEFHNCHWLRLVFFDLLCQRYSQGLHRTLTAHRRGGIPRFHALVFTADALEAHAHLCLPAFFGTGGRFIKLGQRLGHRRHLLGQHFTIAPGDEAVDKAERVDGPGGVVFHFGLIGTEDPMASFIHFQDNCTGWAHVCLDRAQSG